MAQVCSPLHRIVRLGVATCFTCLLLMNATAVVGIKQAGQVLRLDTVDAFKAGGSIVVEQIGALASGDRQAFALHVGRVESLDLRIPFAEAPFSGTQLNVEINGKRLLPYFAFGGDTRYDNVKDKPGMRPPLATIEGRWLIPVAFLRKGRNNLILWTTGVRPDATLDRIGPKPTIRISEVTIRRADGGDLPRYANSIYYDFAIWPQGYPWGNDPDRFHYDMALLGVINGKGMPTIGPSLGPDQKSLWAIKRSAENFALRWGYGHQEFYTIWSLCGRPDLWAKFIDVDKNPQTESRFQEKAIYENLRNTDPAAKGADVLLYDVENYRKALEPAIRALAPYTDFYNFKCEQTGPSGQGFDRDGERWASFGLHADDWSTNFYEACKVARDLVIKYNPDNGRVQEMNHWRPSIRHVLFDTARGRQQPMGDMIDILMTHFTSLYPYDRDKNGNMVPGNTFPKQYPGGQFDASAAWHANKDRRYPEIAIDFNRYRLGRSEKDMTLGDPEIHRWGNGEAFDYRAGFRGDEMMYNSENGIWQGYSAPSPYQFLQGWFAYGLLPTGAGEPRDLKITTRQSLTQTTDIHVNVYGHWIEAAGHTKRLRTVDPLYGDLFGWTGNEHCNSGDYINMVGIKDHHHRRPPFDAYGLVRRMCYAFITTGPVVPAYLNEEHDDGLFVKAMAQVFDGSRYIGLYAANFDEKPHNLDVTLAVPLPQESRAMVFNDRAWDWKSAQSLKIGPGSQFRYRQSIPARGAWLVLIPMPQGGLSQTLDLPAPPEPTSPVPDAVVAEGAPSFQWRAGDAVEARYVVEVAREALFRPRDRVELSEVLATHRYTMKHSPPPRARYFWRVRSVDAHGCGGPWSMPQAFAYHWPEYAETYPPKVAAPVAAPESEKPSWQRLADEHHLETTENLAWKGEIFGSGNRMQSPTRAVDGQAFSSWNNDTKYGKFVFPAQWCVLWPRPGKVSSVKILWDQGTIPNKFAIQVSDDAREWIDLLKSDRQPEPFTKLELAQPVTAKYFRLYITAATNDRESVGMRELVIE